MKTVCKKDNCSGCYTCISACRFDAIRIEDNITSYNAIIDEKKCRQCGLCSEMCPINNKPKLGTPKKWIQGWSKNIQVRNNSTSGGYATSIITAFINNGGVCFSCIFADGEFYFDEIRSAVEIKRAIGSKYVKSSPEGIHKKIDEYCLSGRKVLFIGLPCQVAGVLNYTSKSALKYLYTIDLICHGTPSKHILESFLSQYKYSLNNVKDIKFRRKDKQENIKQYKGINREGLIDCYSYSFIKGIANTENCYNCSYSTIERISDLTLGDSWGSDLGTIEQKKGISLALCNTLKGSELIDIADLYVCEADPIKAMNANKQLCMPIIAPIERTKFFKMFMQGKSFNSIIFRCYPRFFIKQIIKYMIIMIKLNKPTNSDYYISILSKGDERIHQNE